MKSREIGQRVVVYKTRDFRASRLAAPLGIANKGQSTRIDLSSEGVASPQLASPTQDHRRESEKQKDCSRRFRNADNHLEPDVAQSVDVVAFTFGLERCERSRVPVWTGDVRTDEVGALDYSGEDTRFGEYGVTSPSRVFPLREDRRVLRPDP